MFGLKTTLSFLVAFLLLTGCKTKEPLLISGKTMGTTYHIQIVPGKKSVHKPLLQQAIDSLLEEINRQMSTYLPASEISRFNAFKDTIPYRVSPEFVRVVKQSLEIYQQTDGAFDITVAPLVDLWGFGKNGPRQKPPEATNIQQMLKKVGSDKIKVRGDSAISKSNPDVQIDLSAIAKGFAVDEVGRLLKKHGYQNFMVEIGGEVYVSGRKQNRPWRVGIDRPRYGAMPGKAVQEILELENRAVATSGDYRNFFEYNGKIYNHEIDPRTGFPVANGLASVTVIANDCMTADGAATAIMVMGIEKGLQWVNGRPDLEALIIKRTAKEKFQEFFTNGFKNFVAEH